MQLVMEWTTVNRTDDSLKIYVGSQSLLKANECRSPVTYHFSAQCSTGSDIPPVNARPQSNPCIEPADTEAKTAATTTSDPLSPISYASARSLIRRTLTDSSLSVVNNVLNWLMAPRTRRRRQNRGPWSAHRR